MTEQQAVELIRWTRECSYALDAIAVIFGLYLVFFLGKRMS